MPPFASEATYIPGENTLKNVDATSLRNETTDRRDKTRFETGGGHPNIAWSLFIYFRFLIVSFDDHMTGYFPAQVGGIAPISHGMNSSASRVKVRFQWCPAHSKVPGNERAHTLAQNATEKGKKIQPSLRPFPIARSILSHEAKSYKVMENCTSLSRSKTGR